MNQWYYAVNQERKGPVDDAAMSDLVGNGVITPDTLVWRQGLTEWQPYGNVSVVADTEPVADPQPLSSSAPQSIQLGGHTVTEGTKATYVQQLQEGVDPTGKGRRYAGFWIRFAACVIDGVFTSIAVYAIIIPLALLFGGTLMSVVDSTGDESLGIFFFLVILGISIAIPLAYYTMTTGSKMQATFGKKLLGLKVIREDGRPITYGLAFGRYFGFMLSSMILYIGLIMAAFDDQKRALHDHMCGTRVIER